MKQLWQVNASEQNINFLSPVLTGNKFDICDYIIRFDDDYLVLEEASAKRPDAGKDEVQLVPLLGAVGWSVFGRQKTLEQVAQHLQVTVIADRRNLLEFQRQTRRNVLVEENGEVSAFRLYLARINPAAHVPADDKGDIATGGGLDWPCGHLDNVRCMGCGRYMVKTWTA